MSAYDSLGSCRGVRSNSSITTRQSSRRGLTCDEEAEDSREHDPLGEEVAADEACRRIDSPRTNGLTRKLSLDMKMGRTRSVRTRGMMVGEDASESRTIDFVRGADRREVPTWLQMSWSSARELIKLSNG